MAETLTGPVSLHFLREVVAEQPDYVYVSPFDRVPTGAGMCVYVVEDEYGDGDYTCSCLIAHVLVRAGWDPARLADAGGMNDDSGDFPADGWPVRAFRESEMDEDAYRILAAAQLVQDRREPWSAALAEAERVAADLGVTVDGGTNA
jgi:hypothetical protein